MTASYNPEICAERFGRLNSTLTRIRELLGTYVFDELVVLLLGDIVDGTGIYPTQAHHQILTAATAQVDIAVGILKPLLLDQRRNWKSIRIEAVPGNHGRTGWFTHERDNFDMIFYRALRDALAGSRIAVNFEDDIGRDPFLRKVLVRGHSYVIYHGQDIRTFASIPWYGMMLRLSRWLSTKQVGRFDAAFMGHFHSFGTWDINSLKLFLTGTMVTNDDWALRSLGWESANRYWLIGVSDRYPITWQYGLDIGG